MFLTVSFNLVVRLPVAMASLLMVGLCICMAFIMKSSPIGMGSVSVLICFLSIAVHSLMSGTPQRILADAKLTATASGMTDACVYLGTSVQSFAVGSWLSQYGWVRWPLFYASFCYDRFRFCGKVLACTA